MVSYKIYKIVGIVEALSSLFNICMTPVINHISEVYFKNSPSGVGAKFYWLC